MNIQSNRLRWVVVPALALACVSMAAADDRPTVKSTAPAANASAGSAGGPSMGGRVPGASFGARTTSILGNAWNVDNSPIPNARLRLRNVVSGKIEAMTTANEAGQFTFDNIEGGSYVVELVTAADKIRTVGHVFTIAPGETVATFVRAGTKVPFLPGLFSNAASAVSSTAASEGITAIAPVVRLSSPQ
jgi:hypothetical protein